ncbi:MAG: hypothetical protein V4633_13525 [Pseudomonadota bacterium]
MMNNAQLLLIKAEIVADPVLNARPNTSDGADAIATALNLAASPDFFVWQTSMPTQSLFDAIVWANLTPSGAPDGTATWTNLALACQGKQFNIQTMLTGRESINPSKVNIRTGLQDALTQVPSGAAGASRSAGWTTVQIAMQRKATRAEKVLATGTGTAVSPALLGFEGQVSYQDVLDARSAV